MIAPEDAPIDHDHLASAAGPLVIEGQTGRPAGMSGRYRTNREQVIARHPSLAAIVPAEPPGHDRFILSRDGEPAPNPDLPDLTAAARGGGFLVVGVPSPRLLARMLELSGPYGYRPPVDVVEPDAVALSTWLHLVDPGLTRDTRVAIFAGPAAASEYVAFRVAHLARRDPTHVIRCARPGWSPPRGDDDPARQASAAVAARRATLLAEQARFHDGTTPESAAARFRRFRDEDEPLRVLGLTTKYSTVVRHAVRDLAAAFRRRGCVFDVVAEPDHSSNDVDAWSALARDRYDLVIIINALRGQLADRLHARIPCAAWIQDHVASLQSVSAGRTVGPFDRVLCPNPWTLAARFEYPSERLLATSNTTAGDPFAGMPPTEDELAPFCCDVSYVSHASAPVTRLVADLAAPKGEDFHAFLRKIVDGLSLHAAAYRQGIPFDLKLEICRTAEDACPRIRLEPAERAAAIVPLIEVLADRMFRHEALEWVAAWARSRRRSFRLYGAGWEHHPTLAPFACGVIENGRPLACLARACAVSIQVNGYGSLHQRMLDALAAGGFVLSRANNADFVRTPMIDLKAYVAQHDIEDLTSLLDRVPHDPALARMIDRFRSLGLFAIASAGDPVRRREDRLLREVFDFPAELLTDEARFEAIRTGAPAPHRVASDLPGFSELVFDDAASLHANLDHFVADRAARDRCAAPMREAVLGHDTAEVLVDRLVDSFCVASSYSS